MSCGFLAIFVKLLLLLMGNEMKYLGGKFRISKHIMPIILKNREEGQYYVEPFVGASHCISRAKGPRIGNDLDKNIIILFEALQNGWIPPKIVTRAMYDKAKKTKPSPLKSFIGYACSFGGKWFGGYAVDSSGRRNYALEGHKSLMKQRASIMGVKYVSGSYDVLDIPPNSIIYCDPPYKGTTKYKTASFDHDKFWQWCRDKTIEGHSVFISEYQAPEDFESIWEMEGRTTLAQSKKPKKFKERLFVMKKEKEK